MNQTIVIWFTGLVAFVSALALSYMINVAFVATMQWAWNYTFQTTYSFNIWTLSLIVTIVIATIDGRLSQIKR